MRTPHIAYAVFIVDFVRRKIPTVCGWLMRCLSEPLIKARSVQALSLLISYFLRLQDLSEPGWAREDGERSEDRRETKRL